MLNSLISGASDVGKKITRHPRMFNSLMSAASVFAKKITRRPPFGGDTVLKRSPAPSPWLFSIRGDKAVVAYCFPPKNDSWFFPKNDGTAKTALHKTEIPEEFRGHRLIPSCLEDDNTSILLQNEYKCTGIHLIPNPFSSSWTSARTFPCCVRTSSTLQKIFKVVTRGDTVVAIAGYGTRHLVYTTSQFNHWIERMLDEGAILDVLVRKEDDMFYAINMDADKVISVYLKPSSEIEDNSDDFSIQDMTLNLEPGWYFYWRQPEKCSSEYFGWRCCQDARLVTSPAGLFVVRWRSLIKAGEQEERVRQIDVHKLSINSVGEKMWVPVDSLDNYSFFLGYLQSIAVSTQDCPELRSNCIYIPYDAFHIIDDGMDKIDDDDELEGEHDLIYNMKDKTWEQWEDKTQEPWPSMWLLRPPLGEPPLKRKQEELL